MNSHEICNDYQENQKDITKWKLAAKLFALKNEKGWLNISTKGKYHGKFILFVANWILKNFCLQICVKPHLRKHKKLDRFHRLKINVE